MKTSAEKRVACRHQPKRSLDVSKRAINESSKPTPSLLGYKGADITRYDVVRTYLLNHKSNDICIYDVVPRQSLARTKHKGADITYYDATG